MRQICDSVKARGFTLIELIVAMVITGILAAAAAIFLRVPIAGYFDVARRAALTDIADLAVRRFSRDVQTALPNSVRVAGACTGLTPCYLEYLEVRTGGRYREEPSGIGALLCPAGGVPGYNDALTIGTADTCFRSLGTVPDLATIVTGGLETTWSCTTSGRDSPARTPTPAAPQPVATRVAFWRPPLGRATKTASIFRAWLSP